MDLKKQRITLDVDGQMITGLEAGWDMWYWDMTIESGPIDLINTIKQQDLRSNFLNGTGIFALFKENGSNKWTHCIIMGMVDDNLITFRMIQDSTYNAMHRSSDGRSPLNFKFIRGVKRHIDRLVKISTAFFSSWLSKLSRRQ